MANRRENKMTEHILFMIFIKKTSVLSISDANWTQEELSVTRSTRPPLHLLVPAFCAVFHFFCYLLPFLTIKEQYQKIEYFIHVSCDENAENRNSDMFVTNVLHCTYPGK